MRILLAFTDWNIFVISFLLVAALEPEDTIFGNKNNPEPDRESSKYFGINLRISEIPGNEFVKILGEKKTFTDSFSTNHRIVEFLGIPYATPTLKHLRFQV